MGKINENGLYIRHPKSTKHMTKMEWTVYKGTVKQKHKHKKESVHTYHDSDSDLSMMLYDK